MPELPYLTTPQVAEILGVTRQRVAQIAKARGVEPVIVNGLGNVRLWRRSDVRRLKRRPPGRPHKGAADAD